MQGRYEPLGIGVGTRIGGRYDVARRIGSGAMSIVYEVYDRALNNQRVALKLFSPKLLSDQVLLERFRNEVLVTRKLTHPQIIRTYDLGETENGQIYITMELIEGATLDQHISDVRLERMPLHTTVRILRDIANGIQHAHDNGVVHRDLKSANILISNSGEVKIADFGLARTANFDSRLTQDGECVGTPSYMAPEQVRGEEVDQRCDIYALGVIGFELAVGHLPFEQKTWFELASQIVQQPMPKLSGKKAKVPDWFEQAIHKACHKDREKRFQSAAEFGAELEKHLHTLGGDERTTVRREAHRPTVTRELSALFTQHSGLMLVIALGTVVALVAIELGGKAIDSASQNMSQKQGQIQQFADTLIKLQKAAISTMQNKEAIDRFLTEEQRRNGSAASTAEPVSPAPVEPSPAPSPEPSAVPTP